MSAPQKIGELESIRGLAALLIVFFHFPAWNAALGDIRFVHSAQLMVDLFFVLSGFVIYSAYGTRLSTPAQVLRFQFLRLGRLYPVHLLFLLAFLAIEFGKLMAERRLGMVSPNNPAFTISSPQAFVAHLLLVQALWNSGWEHAFNTPSWSISVEFYTYLLFGLLMLAFPRRRGMACAGMALAALLLAQTPVGGVIPNWLRCCFGFFLGCCVAELVRARAGRERLPAGAATVALATMLVFLQFKPKTHELDPLVAVLTAVLIYAIMRGEDGWLRRLLRRPALERLGELSYSVYMSHACVIWFASQVFRVALHRPTAMVDGRQIPQLSIPETLLAWAAIIAVVLVVSALTYRYVEQPLRRASRRVVGADA